MLFRSRAAAQWFVRMDEGEGVFTLDKPVQTLRQTALAAIDGDTSRGQPATACWLSASSNTATRIAGATRRR